MTNNITSAIDFEYTNSPNGSDPLSFRLSQYASSILGNDSINQLVLTIWSGECQQIIESLCLMNFNIIHILSIGISIRCQIVAENLECTISLPTKYQDNIEGLIGNYNGNDQDDLVFSGTTRNVTISSIKIQRVVNDQNILDACESCMFLS